MPLIIKLFDMKIIFLCSAFLGFALASRCQTTGDLLKQQATQGVKEGAAVVTVKAGEKLADKAISKLFDKKKKPAADQPADANKQADPNKSGSTATAATSATTPSAQSEKTTLSTYSKFDFIAGDKILAYDDLSKDALGDYPADWNTNSSGEVVTTSATNGKWLQLTKQGKFIPEYINKLPDNFTFEYDLAYNDKFSYYSPSLTLYLLTGKNDKETFSGTFIQEEKRSGVKLDFHPTAGMTSGGQVKIESFENGQSFLKNEVNSSGFLRTTGKGAGIVHVSIWRQKQRIRVYVDEDKVLDLPRAFSDNQIYATALFQVWGDMKDQDKLLVGNLKLAAGAPDTRNKLITEGKFVTSGILFDVNSDRIKPESYGVLKDIAGALLENGAVRIRITGHTDTDGNATDNLTLSKRRAESVKAALISEFHIDGASMETDGKGATLPVDSNATPEGKANNRRVEFIKL